MVPPDPDPHNPLWQRMLSTALQLVASPGWEGTLKVALLAVVFAGIYLALHMLV